MSAISLAPLLQVQRDLYDLPLGRARFERYLQVMTGGTKELVLPLPAFNPMGKAHVAETLDALLALGAESIAAEAVTEVLERLPGLEVSLVGLVVADDLGGGWTNRAATELANRVDPLPLLERGWVAPLLWTSERPRSERVRTEVLETIYRNVHILRKGIATSLRSLLVQEWRSSLFAGKDAPELAADDLTY